MDEGSPLARRRWLSIPLTLWILSTLGCTCTEVQTRHYVGVFDPQEQVTQELYRITIRGHSKPLSNVQYASGWVPAEAADLLTRSIRLQDHDVQLSGTEAASIAAIMAERRFFEIGPLGVSFEPQDARFVIVMSSDPDYFFQKMSVLLESQTGGSSDTAVARQKEALRRALSTERSKTIKALTGAEAGEKQWRLESRESWRS